MLQPNEATFQRLSGTFEAFLQQEKLEAMVVILKTSHELQGYGYLNEISALYGLLWNKPKFMMAYMLKALPSVVLEALKWYCDVEGCDLKKYKLYIFK